jgi:hypothetical protein
VERRTTALGTPCSPQWSGDWIARVEEAEKQIGRRICGGHGYDGTPCTVPSNHPSGRFLPVPKFPFGNALLKSSAFYSSVMLAAGRFPAPSGR